MRWFKKILIAASALLALAVAGGVGFVWYVFSEIKGRDHVPDELLIKNLETHKAEFQQVITMFREDRPASVIHPTWMSPNNVVSPERWGAYKLLFTELGLDAGMRAWGGESILFISTAQGLVTGGSSKGYMYKPENPSPLFSSLDTMPQDLKSNVMGYRKINDDWYIVFDWDN